MPDDARSYALRLLGQRSYTTKDLERKLVGRQFERESIERTLARLTESGLLDDSKFAASFARAKLYGSVSTRRIRQMLARKGIAQALVLAAIEQVIAEEGIDTSIALEKVARKKFASYHDIDPMVLRRRLTGFLARRGYDLAEIRNVVAKVIDSRQ